MALRRNRNHPIYRLLVGATDGGLDAPDLDALGLPDEVAGRVRRLGERIAGLDEHGNRHMAGQLADELIADLPDTYQSSDFNQPSDPASLASRVQRAW